MDEELAAAAAATAAAIDSLSNSIATDKAQQSANEANIQLARENREWQAEQVEKQNAYNTPSAQMQRWIEAGLNPNLIYSQGTSGNQSSTPSSTVPTVQPHAIHTDIAGAIEQFRQMQELKADIRLKNTQVELNKANAVKSLADAKNKDASLGYLISRSNWSDILNENLSRKQEFDIQNLEFDNSIKWQLAKGYMEKHGGDASSAYGSLMAEKILSEISRSKTAAELESHLLHLRKDFGINPNDSVWPRLLLAGVQSLFSNLGIPFNFKDLVY